MITNSLVTQRVTVVSCLLSRQQFSLCNQALRETTFLKAINNEKTSPLPIAKCVRHLSNIRFLILLEVSLISLLIVSLKKKISAF